MAKVYGIKGWIKNLEDGNVEAIVSGNEHQLKQFITWCKEGPAKAMVEEVIVAEKEEIDFDDFKVMK